MRGFLFGFFSQKAAEGAASIGVPDKRSLVGRGEAKGLQAASSVRNLLAIELELRRGHRRSSFDALGTIFALCAETRAASQAMRNYSYTGIKVGVAGIEMVFFGAVAVIPKAGVDLVDLG